MLSTTTQPTDAILAIKEPYMSQIVSGDKTHEFRKYLLKPSVQRIWFYITAPESSIKYVCEISPAQTREAGDAPLDSKGLGNKEFNERHKDWNGYNYAYEIRSVYELHEPISLAKLKDEYGFKSAPRGMVYLPDAIEKDVCWTTQKKIL